MKKAFMRIAALVLALTMLAGCRREIPSWVEELASSAGYKGDAGLGSFTYTRPDLAEVEKNLQVLRNATNYGGNLDAVINGIYKYYDFYDAYYTNYNLAYIRYCSDVTNSEWEEEYAFCSENSAAVEAGLEEVYRILAGSKRRDQLEGEEYFGKDFFLAYEGESTYDETFLRLLEEEAALESHYYELYEASLETEYYSEEYFRTCGAKMAEVFVELIAKRQEIAAWAGYDSYPQFAYDFYYYRDYTPQQAQVYLAKAGAQLSPLYLKVDQEAVWAPRNEVCTAEDTFAYARSCAEAMGGSIADAFEKLEKNNLYDIAYSEKKMDTSFETFLTTYRVPYIFLCPYQDPYDKLTFVHEFGHFVNDYICAGSVAGTDVAETHSQGMEYLSLFYGENTEQLEKMKMADCLETYVRYAGLALFEHQVYSLTGDQLTVEGVQGLYQRIGADFGFDALPWDSRDYVTIEHLFSQPMYLVSYVVSNDVAFQLYMMEKETEGEGLRIYRQCLLAEDSYILTFAQRYGFENPLAPERLESVRRTLEEILT